jgi:hypothetical protein
MESLIVISIDMDWAPEAIIDYSIALLARYHIRATLFMTHRTDVDVKGHEIAIHPHFTSFDFAKHIKERLDIFPDARGLRSHSFFFTERFRPLYQHFGIKYESNVMMYRQHNIRPYRIAPTTIEMPVFWMDNFYMEMEEPNPLFHVEGLGLHKNGFKVFTFHPIHIFLNTESLNRYETAKEYYNDPQKLLEFRNRSRFPGTRDFLIELLEYVKRNNIQTKTLLEIAEKFSLVDK